MATLVFGIGTVIGVVLIALLVLSLLVPGLRIWPTPGDGSWQGYVFWPLFRSLNVLCFVAAVVDRLPYLGLPLAVRLLALALLVGAVATFVYAFRVLGRDNSYCATDGLVTAGIYQWSRNPQNAMLIVVYACLAVAADSVSAFVLCGAMVTVYWLMVMCEEPWLAEAYGETYRRYCREVPRFFNVRRAIGVARNPASG
jgi:protein-S-isoprenylcysteine O-methyltransferase Ste14